MKKYLLFVFVILCVFPKIDAKTLVKTEANENNLYKSIQELTSFQNLMEKIFSGTQRWYFVQSSQRDFSKIETRKDVYLNYYLLKYKILKVTPYQYFEKINSIFKKTDDCILVSKKIMNGLNSFESYNNDTIRIELLFFLEDFDPMKRRIQELLPPLLDELKIKYEAELIEKEHRNKIIKLGALFLSFIILLAFVFVFLILKSRKKLKLKNDEIIFQKNEIENQKHLVEEKNREIVSSINYALRIQTAILPPQKIVKQYLENSFIVYKPKDIVAGDFYWMENVNNTVLFAACDCTGHGVPGAMVSVVCHNALNRAVREFGLTKPSDILDKTTEIVKENFSKSEDEIKDGMDISLCSLSLNPSPKEREQNSSYTLQWAGANNPLWIVRAGHSELVSESQTNEIVRHDDYKLIETKADKQSIGNSEESKPFSNHEFTLQQGDSIYIFTDGFADQFGGEGEKKLTKRRFKELILSIQNKSMQEQGIVLDKFIVDYRKEIEQTDDILVMGVKILL